MTLAMSGWVLLCLLTVLSACKRRTCGLSDAICLAGDTSSTDGIHCDCGETTVGEVDLSDVTDSMADSDVLDQKGEVDIDRILPESCIVVSRNPEFSVCEQKEVLGLPGTTIEVCASARKLQAGVDCTGSSSGHGVNLVVRGRLIVEPGIAPDEAVLSKNILEVELWSGAGTFHECLIPVSTVGVDCPSMQPLGAGVIAERTIWFRHSDRFAPLLEGCLAQPDPAGCQPGSVVTLWPVTAFDVNLGVGTYRFAAAFCSGNCGSPPCQYSGADYCKLPEGWDWPYETEYVSLDMTVEEQ